MSSVVLPASEPLPQIRPDIDVIAAKLLAQLKRHGSVCRSEVYGIFHGRLRREYVTAGFAILESRGQARKEIVEKTGGRPLELWHLVTDEEPEAVGKP